MRNLNINSLIPSPSDRPIVTPKKPVNVTALGKLSALYAIISTAPVTVERACILGMWYRDAWGVLPTGMRLKASWRMPDYRVIEHLFGSVQEYHVAINRYALGQPLSEETR